MQSTLTPDDIIAALGLQRLEVEGGLWAQSWRDERCSAIYYLLIAPDFSGLHRLDRLEIFNHHAGAPVRMTLLHPDGRVETPVLGTDVIAGERPQVAVPAGVWQGAVTLGEWSLLGTVVSPPYTDDAVEFGRADELAAQFPEHAALLRPLCRY
jgi:predicted cupin superfamily sugar epimerase